MSSTTPLELKVSPYQIAFSLFAIVATLVLFLGRFLWAMWHAPRGFDLTSLVLTVVIGGFITWWIYGGARRMWFETGLYLRADEQTITVATRHGRHTLSWEEIYDFTAEGKSTNGERGYWLSLRGREDQVLAQWDRNWCRYTGGQIKRGDEIENFARAKLRDMGRLSGEENAATRMWEQTHPICSGTALEVRTSYAWIGWMCLLFLPCTFFSWNAPSGGPVVGSIFLLFAALGLYLISAQAVLNVDEERVEATSLYGRSRIEWREVTSVEMDEQGNSVCFVGANKRLCFSGPQYWKGAGRAEMMLFLGATCEKHRVRFETRAKAVFGGSKNTKVSR